MRRWFKKSWEDWSKLQRLVPVIMAVTAFVAVAGANLGFLILSIPEQVILTLLGLLAIDALVERMQILEQIRHGVGILTGGVGLQPSLIWETDILQRSPMHIYLQGARELFVSGGSLTLLLSRERELIQQWLSQRSDARLLLIFEDPETARKGKTPVWSSYIDHSRETYARDIERSLLIVTRLKDEFSHKIEVHLTDQVPSLTVMMIDRDKARIFLNLYMGGPEKRPALDLSKSKHKEWFRLFEHRYRDQLWQESRQWLPTDEDVINSKQEEA
jgi:hypothetical protein